jgi:hypothetical protein
MLRQSTILSGGSETAENSDKLCNSYEPQAIILKSLLVADDGELSFPHFVASICRVVLTNRSSRIHQSFDIAAII